MPRYAKVALSLIPLIAAAMELSFLSLIPGVVLAAVALVDAASAALLSTADRKEADIAWHAFATTSTPTMPMQSRCHS